ncbi:hypothetical protein EXIGLDRAFT_435566 [Exidia glandulosa HHB12029]|uniref:Uncharacterized protein n=1 Tax=Exidia glandulosa HHB12029 TaxID=1314781 RepID=A0A165KG05_EXIGL|nr:hypothetical protein EXIGLDRAFT_435566 [Exidia glandulosa HHB12029]
MLPTPLESGKEAASSSSSGGPQLSSTMGELVAYQHLDAPNAPTARVYAKYRKYRFLPRPASYPFDPVLNAPRSPRTPVVAPSTPGSEPPTPSPCSVVPASSVVSAISSNSTPSQKRARDDETALFAEGLRERDAKPRVLDYVQYDTKKQRVSYGFREPVGKPSPSSRSSDLSSNATPKGPVRASIDLPEAVMDRLDPLAVKTVSLDSYMVVDEDDLSSNSALDETTTVHGNSGEYGGDGNATEEFEDASNDSVHDGDDSVVESEVEDERRDGMASQEYMEGEYDNDIDIDKDDHYQTDHGEPERMRQGTSSSPSRSLDDKDWSDDSGSAHDGEDSLFKFEVAGERRGFEYSQALAEDAYDGDIADDDHHSDHDKLEPMRERVSSPILRFWDDDSSDDGAIAIAEPDDGALAEPEVVDKHGGHLSSQALTEDEYDNNIRDDDYQPDHAELARLRQGTSSYMALYDEHGEVVHLDDDDLSPYDVGMRRNKLDSDGDSDEDDESDTAGDSNLLYNPSPAQVGELLASWDDAVVHAIIDGAGGNKVDLWLEGEAEHEHWVGLLGCDTGIFSHPASLEALARIPHITFGDSFGPSHLRTLSQLLCLRATNVCIMLSRSAPLLSQWGEALIDLPEVQRIVLVGPDGEPPLLLPWRHVIQLLATIIVHPKRTRIRRHDIKLDGEPNSKRNVAGRCGHFE